MYFRSKDPLADYNAYDQGYASVRCSACGDELEGDICVYDGDVYCHHCINGFADDEEYVEMTVGEYLYSRVSL